MRCLQCGHDNPPTARFCDACGANQELACPSCGIAVDAGQKFCTGCGTGLPPATHTSAGAELPGTPHVYTPPHLAEKILATRHAMHGERKQVTVLFCDVVDSTTMARELGAEAMHELLSDFFTVTLAHVHRFEGTVNQFLGDGFMAIFGAPLALEDHATRAALTALAIRDAVAEQRTQNTISGWQHLHVRMGLNSGQLVVGAIGDDLRMDYTASGDITHVAARLEAQAGPDEILCGESTIEAAKNTVDAESLGAVTVKGTKEPIARYRLLSAQAASTRMAQPRAAFVGRGDEMKLLLEAVEKASSAQGGVVEIEGEPGVGKSRLVDEFSAIAGERTRIVQSHCITYGRQVPNVPIVEMVRSLCQIAPQANPTEISQALTRELSQMQSDETDALGAPLGLPEAIERTSNVDPATILGRTTQAILQLVAQASATGTLVLIIEDLHWADASSITYLSALAGSIEGTRCLLVVTFRPGSDPPWGEQSRISRQLLEPLGAQHAKQLVDTLEEIARLSEDQLAQVLARGEGNPFFLQELVRAVAHGSVDDVPGDVFDVLGARIDRLDPDDKDLLRIASVVGRAFTLDLVEEIAQLQSHSRPRFDRMMALGFVAPSGSNRFTFMHALTQEVAYNGMLTQDRKRLHTEVAECLSAKAPSAEEGCEEIARHYLLGIDPHSAVPFLETSIGKAMRIHAMEEANGFFIDALRLLEEEEETPDNIVRRVTLILQEFPVFHFTHRHDTYAALIERYAPSLTRWAYRRCADRF